MKDISLAELYFGRLLDIYLFVRDGDCQVNDYLQSLQKPDNQSITRLLERTADHNPPWREDKFKVFKGKDEGICEFKAGPVRILCMKEPGAFILFTGFKKQGNDTPESEKRKARAMRKEYRAEFYGERGDDHGR